MDSALAMLYLMVIFFGLGLLFGKEIAERNPPNEPPPKKWGELLRKKWMQGYDAGRQAMLKEIGKKASDAEKYEAWKKEHNL